MRNRDLLDRLATLGFPLFGVDEAQDVNKTLTDIVKSKDSRFWEGFPVILANSAEKGLFSYETTKQYLKETSDKSHFASLFIMSLALYRVLGLKFPWAHKLYNSLTEKEKVELKRFVQKLKKDTALKVANHTMSSERLKSVFNSYFTYTQSSLSSLLSAREELGLEYALSQVFSPKQKELFLKKLRRERLTKTEREYFSRVVKKKVLALANPELQRLSRKVLE